MIRDDWFIFIGDINRKDNVFCIMNAEALIEYFVLFFHFSSLAFWGGLLNREVYPC